MANLHTAARLAVGIEIERPALIAPGLASGDR
jgi:hypothetical protein